MNHCRFAFAATAFHSGNAAAEGQRFADGSVQKALYDLPSGASVRGAYSAEQGPDDARPVAVKQALLIDGVLANQIFHHQQKGSDAVSFQSAL